MAYSHCRIQIWIPTRTRIPNPIITLYYAELFTLVRIRMFSQIVTIPILGMNLHPKDRSLSLLHTFQSLDQSPNLNQWEISA